MSNDRNDFNRLTNVHTSYLALGELTDTVVDRIQYDFQVANGRKPTRDELEKFILDECVPALENSLDELYGYDDEDND